MSPETIRDNLKALSAYLIESSGPDFMYQSVEEAIKLLEGWRPIETIPEGQHVLIYFPNGERGTGGIEAATVYRDASGKLDTGGWSHGGPNSGADWEFPEPPTHWMPLPEPPAK